MNPRAINATLDSIGNHLNAGIDSLQHRLTVPAQAIWHAALMHNYAIAATDIAYLLIMVAMLICGSLMIRYQAKLHEGGWEFPGWIAGGVLMIVVALIAFADSGVLSDAIARLASPQYMTAQDIFSALKE